MRLLSRKVLFDGGLKALAALIGLVDLVGGGEDGAVKRFEMFWGLRC